MIFGKGPAPPNLTSDKTSFAYVSARERWPLILTGIIQVVQEAAKNAIEPEKAAEGCSISDSLSKLKAEIERNERLGHLQEDGVADIAAYNKELDQLGPCTWFDVPWLYAECYLYRRISAHLVSSKQWKGYDYFLSQKTATFISSRPAVLELGARYRDIMQHCAAEGSQQTTKPLPATATSAVTIFQEVMEICLWGNATDLSLLTNLSYQDIQKLQGSEARKQSRDKILVNDLPAVYAALTDRSSHPTTQPRRVDIVLDNAGFELYTDLILGGYLLGANLADKIVFHPKSIPWFVSDVLPNDFDVMLTMLSDPVHLCTSSGPGSSQWRQCFADGRFVVATSRTWTAATSYWNLSEADPQLYGALQASDLVVFKGDLNYRKLTGDAMWDPTTPFAQAIGPLGWRSGLRILALRTCKADTVVGLEAGVDELLRAKDGGGGDSGKREWAWRGKWALIQYVDGKDSSQT